MRYINGGVTAVSGPPITTKKALKAAVAADPSEVVFYSTAAEWLPADTRWEGRVAEVPDGVSLSVCGPDPYTKRSWWCNITRKNGKVVAS